MKKERYMSWHTYFMSIAMLSSYRSKDVKQQTGACIVGKDNKIIGIGYNGLPWGCDDDNPVFWCDEDDSDVLRSKHTYVVHAENNAIYNCMVHDMTQARMYTTSYPCNVCAQAIIQVGIKEVIYLDIKPHHKSINEAVGLMFQSADVDIDCYYNLSLQDDDFVADLNKISRLYDVRAP